MARYRKSSQEKRQWLLDYLFGDLITLWKGFWSEPTGRCPKCGTEQLFWFDPFFFAPLRTLQNRRRIKCGGCGYVWRNQRTKRSALYGGPR